MLWWDPDDNTNGGSQTVYKMTTRGFQALAYANEKYKPKSARTVCPSICPNGPGRSSLGERLPCEMPVTARAMPPIDAVEAAFLARGDAHLARQAYQVRVKCRASEALRAIDAARANGIPGTCARKSETPGYFPCRRPPHTEGPCSHEPATTLTTFGLFGRPNWAPNRYAVDPLHLPDDDHGLRRAARAYVVAELRAAKPDDTDGTSHASSFGDGWDAAIAHLEGLKR